MTDYNSFLLKLNKNLNILKEREAKHGGDAPLELLNQIEDHQEAIDLTEQAIAGELSETEWHEALEPLLIAVQTRTGQAASGVTIGDIGGSIEHSIIAGRDVQQTINNVVLLLGQHQGGQIDEAAAKTIADLVLAQVEATNPVIAQGYQKNPAGYELPLSDALAQLLEADRGLVARLDALLEKYEAARPETSTGPIHIRQGDQGQVIIGSRIKGDVLGPGATKKSNK